MTNIKKLLVVAFLQSNMNPPRIIKDKCDELVSKKGLLTLCGFRHSYRC